MTYEIKQFIDQNKLLLSGIAISIVVLYHTGIKIFYLGYLGVDIFMFLSGYFLCYSYSRNNLSSFYKRRYVRIIPIFVLLASIVCITELLSNDDFSLWDYFCNLTSLSYYNIGGSFVDWYLSALLVLYLFFPLFFLFYKKDAGIYLLLILSTLIFLFFSIFDINWKYGCAIGRLPIFIFGIIVFFESKFSKKSNIFIGYTAFLAILSVIFVVLGANIPTYYVFYLLAPSFLLVLCLSLKYIKISSKFKHSLESLGKYSLEIYVGNVIAMIICRYIIDHESVIRGGVILSLTFITSVFCIIYNKYMQSTIQYRHHS